jgi:hypothetical protein
LLTNEGIDQLLFIVAGLSDDTLDGGALCVSDGTQTAEAPFDEPPTVKDGKLMMSATFGEQVANFDWLERDIITANGLVLDHDEEDLGRKAEGAIWRLDAGIELNTVPS